MTDLPLLLVGFDSDPVIASAGANIRIQALSLPSMSIEGMTVTITLENLTTGLYYDRGGFTSAVPVEFDMTELLASAGGDHYRGLHEFHVPLGGVANGDIIEWATKAAEFVRARGRFVVIGPENPQSPDFPLADRRFPIRRLIPRTVVQGIGVNIR